MSGEVSPNIGKVIDNRFTILSRLGAGGMAVVYLAQDGYRNEQVALKFLQPRMLTDKSILMRFHREYKICARFDHPNIVKLFHFGQADDGAYYCAMEYISGMAIDEILQVEDQIEPSRVNTIMSGVCKALSCFHKENIVHRDLKPANIMIAPLQGGGERVVVMDFGLARDMDATALTRTGAVLGTPYYLSPELAMGEKADLRTDVWQIGVITHELLTGEKAFSGTSLNDVVSGILSGKRKLISVSNPDLSPLWDEIIDRCLEKVPSDRYQNTDEILADLEALAAGRPLGRRKSVKKKSKKLKKTGAVSAVTKPALAKAEKNSKTTALVVGAFILLLLVFLIWPKRPVTYGMSNLRANPGVGSLTVTWNSEVAYQSKIQLLKPVARIYESTEKAGRSHRVLLTGLPAGRPVSFRVLYPSGETSLAKSAVTAKANFEFTNAKKRAGGFDLSFTMSPPAKCQFSSKGNFSAAKGEDGQNYTIFLPDDMNAGKLSATYLDGVKNEFELALLLKEQIKTLCRQMGNKTLSQFVKRKLDDDPSLKANTAVGRMGLKEGSVEMQRYIDEKAAKEAAYGQHIAENVHKFLADGKSLKAFVRAKSISPFILSSPIVGSQTKLEFFHCLQEFFTFSIYTTFKDGNLDKTIARPDFGDFAMTYQARRKSDYSFSIFKNFAQPIVLGIPMPFQRKCARSWRRTFNVPAKKRYRYAEFFIQMDSASHAAYRLHLNKSANIIVFDRRSHKLGGVKLDVFQRVPVELLKDGANEIELLFEPLLQKLTDRRHVIYELTLLLMK